MERNAHSHRRSWQLTTGLLLGRKDYVYLCFGYYMPPNMQVTVETIHRILPINALEQYGPDPILDRKGK